MANKTVYVRESDLLLWDWAQIQLGESISTLFAEFLRERVKTMNAFVRVLRSAPNSQNLVVTFAPTGPDGSGGSLAPHYVHESQLVAFLEGNGVTDSDAIKIASELQGVPSVSELIVIPLTVPQRVAAFLKSKAPAAFCDECIANSIGLQRHQQAQQATLAGAASGGFTRERGTCSNCHKNVMVTRG
jgi:hypothetical protein